MRSHAQAVVIGGGVNGCGIARDAVGRGFSVLLAEKGDLAGGTSSASTKLIHGGLRYLEYYEFKLVREALMERERLLAQAPHLIHPLHFVLPHRNAVRPWWMVRLGLWLYDTIGGRISLPRSRSLKPSDTLYRAPLKEPGKGFVYSDCWVDDSRLVVLNALDAAERAQLRRELVLGRPLQGPRRPAFRDERRDLRLQVCEGLRQNVHTVNSAEGVRHCDSENSRSTLENGCRR